MFDHQTKVKVMKKMKKMKKRIRKLRGMRLLRRIHDLLDASIETSLAAREAYASQIKYWENACARHDTVHELQQRYWTSAILRENPPRPEVTKESEDMGRLIRDSLKIMGFPFPVPFPMPPSKEVEEEED